MSPAQCRTELLAGIACIGSEGVSTFASKERLTSAAANLFSAELSRAEYPLMTCSTELRFDAGQNGLQSENAALRESVAALQSERALMVEQLKALHEPTTKQEKIQKEDAVIITNSIYARYLARELCHTIEKLGASPDLTDLSMKASEIYNRLESRLQGFGIKTGN